MPPAAAPLASGPRAGTGNRVIEHAGDHLRREVGQVDEGDEDGLGHSAALVGRRGEGGEACSQRGTDALSSQSGQWAMSTSRPSDRTSTSTSSPAAPRRRWRRRTSGRERVDRPLDEGGLVGDAQQCLGATPSAAGARREHEPAHVWHASVPKGAGVEGSVDGCGEVTPATLPRQRGMPQGEDLTLRRGTAGVCLVDSRRRKWFASGSLGWRQLLRAHTDIEVTGGLVRGGTEGVSRSFAASRTRAIGRFRCAATGCGLGRCREALKVRAATSAVRGVRHGRPGRAERGGRRLADRQRVVARSPRTVAGHGVDQAVPTRSACLACPVQRQHPRARRRRR